MNFRVLIVHDFSPMLGQYQPVRESSLGHVTEHRFTLVSNASTRRLLSIRTGLC